MGVCGGFQWFVVVCSGFVEVCSGFVGVCGDLWWFLLLWW